MDGNIYLKLEDFLDSIEMNLHNIVFIKENVENIRKLNKTVLQTELKFQLTDIVNKIDSLLLESMKSERDKEIIGECKKAKQLLYSIPTKVLHDFQKRLEKTNIDEFRIINHDGTNIILAGSFDFCYYHEVEVMFLNVDFICSPSHFKANTFRLATNDEIISLNIFMNEFKRTGLTFCMEDRSFGEKSYIVALGLNINWGTVYYYKRENLQDGERIADWIENA